MASAESSMTPSTLPHGDVVRILMDQHNRIREMLDDVDAVAPSERAEPFARLRAMLAVHETAEEMIVRPVTSRAGDKNVANSRNQEEAEATVVLKQLEAMDAGSPEFGEKFASFKDDVLEHAEREETEEFPLLMQECDLNKRASMGRSVHSVEELAPTHPHPSAAGSPAALWTLGPFAAMVDRVKDVLAGRENP